MIREIRIPVRSPCTAVGVVDPAFTGPEYFVLEIDDSTHVVRHPTTGRYVDLELYEASPEECQDFLKRDTRPMSKHTPGPWRAQDCYVFAESDQMMVCEMRGWGRLTGTGGGLALSEGEALAIQDANARLVAAAPEMLEMLKRAARGQRNLAELGLLTGEYAENARTYAAEYEAVISKAEGARCPTTTNPTGVSE